MPFGDPGGNFAGTGGYGGNFGGYGGASNQSGSGGYGGTGGWGGQFGAGGYTAGLAGAGGFNANGLGSGSMYGQAGSPSLGTGWPMQPKRGMGAVAPGNTPAPAVPKKGPLPSVLPTVPPAPPPFAEEWANGIPVPAGVSNFNYNDWANNYNAPYPGGDYSGNLHPSGWGMTTDISPAAGSTQSKNNLGTGGWGRGISGMVR